MTEGCGRPEALLQRPQGRAPPGPGTGRHSRAKQGGDGLLLAIAPGREGNRPEGEGPDGAAGSRGAAQWSGGHPEQVTAHSRQQRPNLLSSRSSPPTRHVVGQGSLPHPGQRVIPAFLRDQPLVTGPAVGPDGRMHRGPLCTGLQILRPHPPYLPHPPGRGVSLRTTLRPRPAHGAPAPSAPLGPSRVEPVSVPVTQ